MRVYRELEGTRKEAVYLRTHLELLIENHEILGHCNRCFSRDSNTARPKYESRALSRSQPILYKWYSSWGTRRLLNGYAKTFERGYVKLEKI
jgi:hypothetical protein